MPQRNHWLCGPWRERSKDTRGGLGRRAAGRREGGRGGLSVTRTRPPPPTPTNGRKIKSPASHNQPILLVRKPNWPITRPLRVNSQSDGSVPGKAEDDWTQAATNGAHPSPSLPPLIDHFFNVTCIRQRCKNIHEGPNYHLLRFLQYPVIYPVWTWRIIQR